MMNVTGRRSRPRKRAQKTRWWLLLFRIAAWATCAGVFWCGYLLWLINGYDTDKMLHKVDAGIILGAALWNDVPSPALKERLDYALQLMKDGKLDKLILTGGLGAMGSTITEAEGMRIYLMDRGISADKLLLENEATSTFENLQFSKSIANANDLKKLIIITHDYHAARAREIANYLGYSDTEVAGTKSTVLNPVYNESREVLAFTKWKVDWLLYMLKIRSPEKVL